MYKKIYITIVLAFFALAGFGQAEKADTLKTNLLDPITVSSYKELNYLPDVREVFLFSGKRTNIVNPNDGDANLTQNLGRTIFAKIPGINLWDMDGSGTQMNIGSRGTDAHRSIEMNMRQNGYNTNSDMFGYPENHYSVPMQGVQQIQLVRGSAALQFGSQFGGMMNYVMKEGDSTKAFSIESEQTKGSYNFFNSYNAVGGRKGKISYYAYYDNRHGDGWRPNAAFNYGAFYGSVKYQFNEQGSLTLQFSRMDYRQQIAGGLTDAMFAQNSRQSNRSRNYFNPKINIPALTFRYAFSERTRIQVTANGLWGERSSVQFINTANINDTINTATKSYNPRQVDRDFYKSFTTEARILHEYNLGAIKSVLTAGARFFDEQTKRRQKGKGTAGSDFDLALVSPYGIDLKFHTTNVAFFAENMFKLTDRFSITPGARWELINSNLTGVINNASFPVAYKGNRSFPLFGTGVQYQVSATTQLYANISQAYRPFLYASVTPADQIGVIDPNLKDSKGYDADAGYRGRLGEFVQFDVNAYYLYYGNKIGKLTETAANNSTYQLTTNIGNSVAKGFELYVNVSLLKAAGGNTRNGDIRLFTSTALTHARYVKGALSNNVENIPIVGNKVENVPDWIVRSGLELRYKGLSGTLQSSHTSSQFTDANNTTFTATGLVGRVPSYTLYDFSVNYRFLKMYHVSAGINNLTDTRYFSRRINMYPGPGILPGDGRTFYFTLGFKI